MNKEVNFEIAKLLKEKGFSWECRHFYSKSKYDKEFYLKTGTEYESDRDCIWDWNLNGGKSGMLSKIIPYPNDSDAIYYSAPTIAEIVMWLYEKHDIWISIIPDSSSGHKLLDRIFSVSIFKYSMNINVQVEILREDKNILYFNKIENAYEAAIKYTLENLL